MAEKIQDLEVDFPHVCLENSIYIQINEGCNFLTAMCSVKTWLYSICKHRAAHMIILTFTNI